MKIVYSKKYSQLSQIQNFPVVGLWYELLWLCNPSSDLGLDNLISQYGDFYNNYISRVDWLYGSIDYNVYGDYNRHGGILTYGIQPTVSGPHKAKAIIKDGKCKMSITIPSDLKYEREGCTYDPLFLVFALDLVRYPDGDITRYGDVDSFIKDPSNLSFLLLPPIDGSNDGRINPKVSNIIEIDKPECSFRNSLKFGTDQDESTHYIHGEIDRATLYDSWINNSNQFIESESGYERSRALQGSEKPVDVQGHLTIGTNGIIHL